MRNLGLVLFGFFGLFTWVTRAANDSTPAGLLEKIEGSVVVLDASGKQRLKLGVSSESIPFYVLETLEVGEKSRAKIKFKDQSQILLEAGSSFTVRMAHLSAENIIRRQKHFEARLNRGKMRIEIDQKYSTEKGEKFEVHTPNAVAGVRGTIFTLEFQEAPKRTLLEVMRGRVHFNRRGESELEFLEGQKSEIVGLPAEKAAPAGNANQAAPQNKL